MHTSHTHTKKTRSTCCLLRNSTLECLFFKNYRVSLKRWHLQPNCLQTYMLPRPGKHKIHYKCILQPIILLPLAFQKAINLQKQRVDRSNQTYFDKVWSGMTSRKLHFQVSTSMEVYPSNYFTHIHSHKHTHAHVLPMITICQRVNLFKGWIKSNCQLITEHAKQSKNNSDFNWELRCFQSIATVAVQMVTLNAEQL